MAVALLLNTTDLAVFLAALQDAATVNTGADRTAINRIVTAIGVPSALPVAPVAFQQGDPDTRVLLLPSTSGTKQQVLDLLDRAYLKDTARFNWLRAFWKDARTSAVANWVG